jgi:hypothetical protein
MANLLQEIVGYCGNLVFSSGALIFHAPDLPTLEDAIIGVCGIMNARRLGHALKRWEGVELEGMRITRDGLDAAGVVWRIVSL